MAGDCLSRFNYDEFLIQLTLSPGSSTTHYNKILGLEDLIRLIIKPRKNLILSKLFSDRRDSKLFALPLAEGYKYLNMHMIGHQFYQPKFLSNFFIFLPVWLRHTLLPDQTMEVQKLDMIGPLNNNKNDKKTTY